MNIFETTLRRGIDEIADNALEKFQKKFQDALFNDVEAAAVNSNAFGRGLAAITYVPRKILSDVGGGIIGLPRILFNPDIGINLVSAAANPVQTVATLRNEFNKLSTQDKLVAGLEVLLPFKGKITQLGERLPGVGQVTLGASRADGLTFTTKVGERFGFELPPLSGSQLGAGPVLRVVKLENPAGASVTELETAQKFDRPTPKFTSDGLRIPFGFKNEQEFFEFSKTLRAGLPEGVEPVFQGSSVTGVKAVSSKGIRAGAPFDVGRVSDFDIGLISEELTTQAALIDGVRIKTGPTRIGPIGASGSVSNQLGLGNLAQILSQQAGRNVSFVLFDSAEGAFSQPTIFVP